MWGLVQHCPSAARFGALGQVVGLDWALLFLIAPEFRVSRLDLARLLPALEAGMLSGLYPGEADDEPAMAGSSEDG